MKSRRKSNPGLFGISILIFIAVPVGLIWQQVRQNQLDLALIKAVKRLDQVEVNRLLRAGANANARDGAEPMTLTDLYRNALSHIRGNPVSPSTGAPLLEMLVSPTLQRIVKDDHFLERRPMMDPICVALIQHGANLSDCNCPLHLAALNGFHNTVRLLLDIGMDPNERNGEGSTPLAGADLETTLILIGHGANVNGNAPGTDSCLVCAIRSQRPEVVRVLLEHGANVNALSEEGFTALLCAQTEGGVVSDHEEIIRLLRKHGASQ